MTALLLRRWRALAGENADELGEALISAWAEPQRRYHDHGHLIWLLDEADRRAALIRDPRFVGFAIWFHDAYYHPTHSDNEELSADWANTMFGDLPELNVAPDLATKIVHAILMTKNHAAGEAGDDTALFLDMDIAILGAPIEVYRFYAAAIRDEYLHVPPAAFAAGRAEFLDRTLTNTRTFRTDLYEVELGEQARANMRWEREEMRRGRMIKGGG